MASLCYVHCSGSFTSLQPFEQAQPAEQAGYTSPAVTTLVTCPTGAAEPGRDNREAATSSVDFHRDRVLPELRQSRLQRKA